MKKTVQLFSRGKKNFLLIQEIETKPVME